VPIGISEEHEALRVAVRRWVDSHCPPAVPRARLEAESDHDAELWQAVSEQGWLGLHVDERHGGQGYGLLEVAVVLEELGRALLPGPFLPTILAAALISDAGTPDQQAAWLPSLASGEAIGAVSLDGSLRPVLGAPAATLFLVAETAPEGEQMWCVLDRSDVEVDVLQGIDQTRRVGAVRIMGTVPANRRLPALTRTRVRDIAATLLAAEAAGGASWCLDTAASYAKVREQFGRPIGQFQAVKHRISDMLVAVERARAAAYDAALAADDSEGGPLAAAVAGAAAPDAFFTCAKDCIQVLGGIGFTWEHDAHMYLRRATALRQLLGGPADWRRTAAELAIAGTRRALHVELPPGVAPYRAHVRAFLDELKAVEKNEWRARLADAGYIAPHWPNPWGRDATPIEQLVIDEEFREAHVRRPHLQVGAWALPTLITYGSREQQERWVGPSMRGEIEWCQLFSEPGAGSDLASLTTKASRTDGGWLLSGQKVWTTFAHQADWGICLARTNPAPPKHAGITYFIVDMKSDGIEARPLRELTGFAMFNEVFLSDVFVPDDCVVGGVDDGWRLARTTLANERVSMADGSSFAGGVEGLVALVGEQAAGDPVALDELGGLVTEAQTLSVLAYRTTLRALSGADPGPEASVRKLMSVEHDQRVQEAGLTLLGPAGAVSEGEGEKWGFGFLANRCLTIAGGTSEVQRNVIAERLLGLPRDP
jgi:alkylation response protein AidB-like acyl-CoA dehydrogenase